MAFKLEQYRRTLETLKKSQQRIGSVSDFFELDDGHRPQIVLRHDVDRLPKWSVEMARLEAEFKMRSTYYFRMTKKGQFPKSELIQIATLGHETGYHYETLSQCDGDLEKAIELFRSNLGKLRALSPCKTVAMHGAPLSPHYNQDLLVGKNLADFGLIADAGSSFSATPLYYFTDTGGEWNTSGRNNLRDHVAGSVPLPFDVTPDDSDQFLKLIQAEPHLIYLSAHPERWGKNAIQFGTAQARDSAVNLAKIIIRTLRKNPA